MICHVHSSSWKIPLFQVSTRSSAPTFINICFLDVTIPPTINCTPDQCQHMVLYGKHFDEQAWFRWTSANDTISGKCEFWEVSMGPMNFVAKHMRLQHHILRTCAK